MAARQRVRAEVRLGLVVVALPAVFVAFLVIRSHSLPLAYLFAFVAAVTLTSVWIATVKRSIDDVRDAGSPRR